MNAEAEQVPEGRDYEAEAKAQGWSPDFKGDPDKFKSAEQFVKDGENIPAILKSRVDKLEGRVEQLLDSNQKLNEFSKKAQDRERKEKEKVISELQELRKQAISDGDGDAFDSADKQINELNKVPDEAPPLDPNAQKWLDSNKWYETNAKLQAFADGMADRIVAEGFTGKAYFDELTKRTKEVFPEEFGNKNREKPNAVSDSVPVADSSAHTFDALPKEAKEAYATFKRDIPGFTKDQFVEQYDWD